MRTPRGNSPGSAVPMARRPWPQGVLHLVLGIVIATYFFALTRDSLAAGFTHDDLMNMWLAWKHRFPEHLRDVALFFTPAATFRPAGSILYSTLFEIFGFRPEYFRIACHLILAADVTLAYAIAFQLSRCILTSALATLLFCYHGEFWPVYTNTGVCYDLLCCLFYLAALLLYVSRRRVRLLNGIETAVWLLLLVMALNAKEMAVSLPPVMLAYEYLFHRPAARDFRSWITGNARVPLLGAAAVAMFIAGRLFGPRSIRIFEGYVTDFRPEIVGDRLLHFLSLAVYGAEWLGDGMGLAVAIGAVALLFRGSPLIRLCLVWVLIGVLPVAFIPRRGLDAVLLPFVPVCIIAAAGAVWAIRRLLRVPRSVPGEIAVVVCAMLVILGWHRWNGLFKLAERRQESTLIHSVYGSMREGGIHFGGGSRILLSDDPFPAHPWSAVFLVLLYARDRTVDVDRSYDVQPGAQKRYSHVLLYRGGRLQIESVKSK